MLKVSNSELPKLTPVIANDTAQNDINIEATAHINNDSFVFIRINFGKHKKKIINKQFYFNKIML